tara:strand:+ start:34613 stop:35233 length:621 start_codon:yes stop_codon:yes gene_type:complete
MKSLKEYMTNEDSVDSMKHDKINDMFLALERLNDEYDELEQMDREETASGVGDLTDQLTTMGKLISGLYAVLDRSSKIVPMESTEEVKEAVDQALIDQVVDEIRRDIEFGDVTAIEELLMSVPEPNLRGFLSEVGESVNEEVIRIRAVKDKEDLKLPTTGINRKFDGPDAKEHAAKAKKQFEKDGYHVVYETDSKDLEYLKKLAGI